MSTKKIIISILGVFVLGGAIAKTALAGDFYVSPSVATIDAGEADFRVVNLTGGYDFNEYVGVRGSWMVGAEDETLDGVTFELDQMYGGDLVFSLPFDSFSPYAFVGETWIKVNASYNGYSATASDSYTTYGLGLNFALRESAGLFVEYKDVDGADVISAGLKFEF